MAGKKLYSPKCLYEIVYVLFLFGPNFQLDFVLRLIGIDAIGEELLHDLSDAEFLSLGNSLDLLHNLNATDDSEMRPTGIWDFHFVVFAAPFLLFGWYSLTCIDKQASGEIQTFGRILELLLILFCFHNDMILMIIQFPDRYEDWIQGLFDYFTLFRRQKFQSGISVHIGRELDVRRYYT